MLDADRIFLTDFMNLTFKNHMMAVESLRQAGGTAQLWAAIYLRRENPALTAAEATALEAQTNEGARFQATMFAKIFAEFVGAVEDFGGLCFAIRNRGTEGILARYLGSEPRDVATFFDHVLTNPGENLGTVFRLPDLPSIQPNVQPAMFTVLSNHYANAPAHIAQVATVYRTPPSATLIQDLSALPPDWRQRVHVMLEAPGTAGVASTRGAIPQVFNKIKHRFMLMESPDEYAKLPTASQYRVVAIEMTGPRVEELVEALHRVSMGSAEIAATILELDRAGVAI